MEKICWVYCGNNSWLQKTVRPKQLMILASQVILHLVCSLAKRHGTLHIFENKMWWIFSINPINILQFTLNTINTVSNRGHFRSHFKK